MSTETLPYSTTYGPELTAPTALVAHVAHAGNTYTVIELGSGRRTDATRIRLMREVALMALGDPDRIPADDVLLAASGSHVGLWNDVTVRTATTVEVATGQTMPPMVDYVHSRGSGAMYAGTTTVRTA